MSGGAFDSGAFAANAFDVGNDQAALAVTLGNATLAGSAIAAAHATDSTSLGDATLAGSAIAAAHAADSTSLGDTTLVGTAVAKEQATESSQLADATASATATAKARATETSTLGDASVVAAAVAKAQAGASSTLDDASLVSTATVSTAPTAVVAMRTAVAAAMIAKLARLEIGGSASGFLEAIIPIAFCIDGKHDDYGIDLLWRTLGGRSPSVAIAPSAMLLTQAGGPGRSRGELTVDVYIVGTQGRDITEGRAAGDAIAAGDDSADPGVFSAVELVWALLFDCDLGVAHVQQLKLHSEGELITDYDKTIWCQKWKVVVTRDANMYRGIVQKLVSMHTTMSQSAVDPDPIPIVEDTTVG